MNEAEPRAEHIDPVPTKARPLAYNVVDLDKGKNS